MARRSRTLGFRKKLLLLAGGLLVALVLLEGSVRVFGPPIEYVSVQEVVADPRLGYRLRPGFDSGPEEVPRIQVSAQGFRDAPYGEREPDALRVLVLGDSFTFGKEVAREQLYTEVLERALQESFPDRSVSVLNTGAPSWATFQEALLLEEVGTDFRPDVVILQYYVNDLADNLRAHEKGVALLAQRVEKGSMGGTLLRPLMKVSQAARLGWSLYQQYRTAAIAAREAPEDGGRAAAGGDVLEERCLGFVEQVRQECERLAAHLVLFVIREAEGNARGQPPAEPPAEHFLVRYAAERALPVLTFTEAVERAGADYAACKTFHFTVQGHEVAGVQLRAVVEEAMRKDG